MIEPDHEIPTAVAEYWPKLRFYFERECLNLCKEERERTPEQPDYNQLGIAAVTCAKLLDRIDRLMNSQAELPSRIRQTAAPLKTFTPESK